MVGRATSEGTLMAMRPAFPAMILMGLRLGGGVENFKKNGFTMGVWDVWFFPMSIEPIKDGLRSQVRIDFYGHVHKRMRGFGVEERYAREVEVLKVLEERGCPYVPRVLEEFPEEHYFVSTNCGRAAPQLSKEKADRLFEALERDYGVKHLDAEPRNITYSDKLGRFCIIDFELAEILPDPGVGKEE